jgi:hypothetical protein
MATELSGGAAAPQMSSPRPAAGEGGGLLLVGSIGAFALALVLLITVLMMFGIGSGPLMMVIGILGLGAYVGLGIGFLGYQKQAGDQLAMGVAILLFITAVLSLLPLFGRSMSTLKVIFYVAPIVGLITWSLASVVVFKGGAHLGPTSKIVGVAFLLAGIWQGLQLVFLFARMRPGVGKELVYAGVALIVFQMIGVALLGAGFLKMRGSQA